MDMMAKGKYVLGGLANICCYNSRDSSIDVRQPTHLLETQRELGNLRLRRLLNCMI